MALSSKSPGSFVALEIYKLPRDTDLGRIRDVWQAAFDVLPIWRTRIITTLNGEALQVAVQSSILWHSDCNLATVRMHYCSSLSNLGGQLYRLSILREPTSDDIYLCLRAHHALYDAWSLSLTLRQVEDAYHGAQPAGSAHVDQFVKACTQLEDDRVRDFWSLQSSSHGAEAFPCLPYSSYTPQANCQLHSSLILGLRTRPRATIATVVKCAWAFVQATYSGSRDVIVGEVSRTSTVAIASSLIDMKALGPSFRQAQRGILMHCFPKSTSNRWSQARLGFSSWCTRYAK